MPEGNSPRPRSVRDCYRDRTKIVARGARHFVERVRTTKARHSRGLVVVAHGQRPAGKPRRQVGSVCRGVEQPGNRHRPSQRVAGFLERPGPLRLHSGRVARQFAALVARRQPPRLDLRPWVEAPDLRAAPEFGSRRCSSPPRKRASTAWRGRRTANWIAFVAGGRREDGHGELGSAGPAAEAAPEGSRSRSESWRSDRAAALRNRSRAANSSTGGNRRGCRTGGPSWPSRTTARCIPWTGPAASCGN